MARRSMKMPTRVLMLRARITMTETGYPAPPEEVFGYLKGAKPCPEDGWWWVGATPKAAASISRDGHKAVGTELTTWYPPQTIGTIDEDAIEPEGRYQPCYDESGAMIGVRT